VLAPVLAPFAPDKQVLADRLQGPSGDHWLGTDDFGRDQLSRLLYGTRVSMGAALLAVAVGVLIGAPAGLVSGYVGGKVDALLRAVFDGLMSVPGIIFAIAFVAALGTGLNTVMIAIGIVFSPRFFRIQRATTISVAASTSIEACEAIGCTRRRILWRHLIPNSFSPTLVQVTLTLGLALVAEASLSFIGLGAQPPSSSWGTMIADAYPNMERAPHLVFPPGLAIVATVLAFSWFSDGLQSAFSTKRSGE
jgi:peptide/nickel transport system permease protein